MELPLSRFPHSTCTSCLCKMWHTANSHLEPYAHVQRVKVHCSTRALLLALPVSHTPQQQGWAESKELAAVHTRCGENRCTSSMGQQSTVWRAHLVTQISYTWTLVFQKSLIPPICWRCSSSSCPVSFAIPLQPFSTVCLLYNCWSPQEVFPHTRKQGARCSPMPTNCLLTSGRHTLPFGRAYHKHPISPTNHSTEIQINPRLEAAFICSSICILCKWSKPHLEGFLCSTNTKQLTFAFIITIIIIYYLIITYCLWGLAIVLQIS